MGKCLGEILFRGKDKAMVSYRPESWVCCCTTSTVTALQDGRGGTINKVSDEASLGGLKSTQRLGKYFEMTLTNRNTKSDRKGPQEMLALSSSNCAKGSLTSCRNLC